VSLISLFDGPRYAKTALNSALAFRDAKPFPHIKFDHFLPAEAAHLLSLMYPDPNRDAGWTTHANPNVKRMFSGNEVLWNPVFRLFAQATASRQFLLFLETLSGITGLIPDPYYIGGGAMVAGRDDFLNMHCDFNWHYKLHCHRRLNALFYLTPDWKEEWGGALRLEGQEIAVYAPLFNRVIIFEVSDTAWHGQPTPMTCPEGTWRRVFSAFYYTAATDQQINDPHLTKYRDETPYTAKPLKEYQGAM
jgi:hypothetical protein